MTVAEVVIRLVYLAAATSFVMGLHLMNSPASAKRGNAFAAAGMTAAVAATLILLVAEGTVTITGWIVLAVGAATGSLAGLYWARSVPMTAMPQLVSLFNAVGGGAAAVVGIDHFLHLTGDEAGYAATAVAVFLDVLIGAVAFSGSLVAAGKLQGWISGSPIAFPGHTWVNAALAIGILVAGGFLVAGAPSPGVLFLITVAALVLGVLFVLPIGGADMPVVVSLLNAATGLAVAMAGFVLANEMLIIAGALVGASGSILTKLMADAMNRPLTAIVAGGFGTGDTQALPTGDAGQVQTIAADDAAIRLAYANRVIIVPGYGLAAAQAQHELRELAGLLEEGGVHVTYAIHPVAGRMPGHMNVLLAEAKVPYEQMKEMDEVNPEFPRADVALVVGANDVTNPAARNPGSPISGMPILDVDQAETVIVIKRSLGSGYAGIDNELYTNPRTHMFLADAATALSQLGAAVKTFVR
ncbi:NAD(P)(+) transhydrogenase (Re/Si-specific) subunit beta [Spiractinospora alimapuensis]|uniref:NAD(P)(+) transhydrogenase (Re/Si-specific) subunit beta n=1 Tax=Spiractinospora alimapuensis TaxID=2820884 RepID=UPI001F2C20B3|nr:NAD(P)(+) transhydrogenase (Re/Si-specific) subunit beta [Spiractinospora alimapuensis]QVQ52897.1 NAD(P)(+) transhydrogenase (Re/Si-specific) subunit beta [Spiractinospora alimapuensis]